MDKHNSFKKKKETLSMNGFWRRAHSRIALLHFWVYFDACNALPLDHRSEDMDFSSGRLSQQSAVHYAAPSASCGVQDKVFITLHSNQKLNKITAIQFVFNLIKINIFIMNCIYVN